MQDLIDISGSLYFLFGNELGFTLLLGIAVFAESGLGPPGALRARWNSGRLFNLVEYRGMSYAMMFAGR